jgi:hypothetical protein
VEVKIGVQHAPREIVLESSDSPEGRRVLVPADKLAYVEIGEIETRRVGFGTM